MRGSRHLKAALANKHREGALFVVNDIVLPEIKTKKMLELFSRLQLQQSVLVVIADANEQVEKATRNIPWAKVLRSEGINVYDLLHYKQVLFTQAAFQKVNERLAA